MQTEFTIYVRPVGLDVRPAAWPPAFTTDLLEVLHANSKPTIHVSAPPGHEEENRNGAATTDGW
jgi:hypothetical protein